MKNIKKAKVTKKTTKIKENLVLDEFDNKKVQWWGIFTNKSRWETEESNSKRFEITVTGNMNGNVCIFDDKRYADIFCETANKVARVRYNRCKYIVRELTVSL